MLKNVMISLLLLVNGDPLIGYVSQPQECIVLLDESGSMQRVKDQALQKLSELKPNRIITFGNHKIKERGTFVDYKPFGNSPLYDAMGYCVEMINGPQRICIITDCDNRVDGKKMIDTGSRRYDWQKLQDIRDVSPVEFEFIILENN